MGEGAYIAVGARTRGLGRGKGGTRCYAKQPHLTDEIITPTGSGRGGGHGVGRRGGRKPGGGGGKGEGPGPRYCALSAPTPRHLPTSAHHRSLGLPSVPSFLPLLSGPKALKLSSTAPPSALSGRRGGRPPGSRCGGHGCSLDRRFLQRLVAFLLQVTVVVLLGRQRHAVQRVMGVQPLLLLQCQALQLSGLRVHGLQLVGC